MASVKFLTVKKHCDPSAAVKGDVASVEFLTVKKHCDPAIQNIYGNIALHYAVAGGHLEIVQFFLEEIKCSLDIAGQHNMTLLEMAIHINHPDITQYLQ